MCVGDEDLEAVCSCLKGAHTANLREWQCRSSHYRELITRTEQTCPLPSSCFYGISKAQLDAQPPEDMCLWTGKEVAKHHPLALQWGKKSIGAVAVMARAARLGCSPAEVIQELWLLLGSDSLATSGSMLQSRAKCLEIPTWIMLPVPQEMPSQGSPKRPDSWCLAASWSTAQKHHRLPPLGRDKESKNNPAGRYTGSPGDWSKCPGLFGAPTATGGKTGAGIPVRKK